MHWLSLFRCSVLAVASAPRMEKIFTRLKHHCEHLILATCEYYAMCMLRVLPSGVEPSWYTKESCIFWRLELN